MDERRFNLMVEHSIRRTPVSKEDWYTEEEFAEGYHFCGDWDGLFIGPDSPEWDCCTCHPFKHKGESK